MAAERNSNLPQRRKGRRRERLRSGDLQWLANRQRVRLGVLARRVDCRLTWNVYAPSVVGVPEMTPFASVSPGGSVPAITDQVRAARGAEPVGGLRFVTSWASSVAEYGAPTVATCGSRS